MVEDSDSDAQLITHWLRRGGFEPIVERVDISAAMRTALAGQKLDIIISDYYMPSFNGLEALALWKESGLNIPSNLQS